MIINKHNTKENMDISVFRKVANVSNSGNIEVIAASFWDNTSVLEDVFGYHNPITEAIVLPQGWHDVGLYVSSQDGDFEAGQTLEIRLGRWNSGTPSWGQLQERDLCGITRPKRHIRGGVKIAPTEDDLAVGLQLIGGTAGTKDVVVEVQIFS